jgi:hypothetical protein
LSGEEEAENWWLLDQADFVAPGKNGRRKEERKNAGFPKQGSNLNEDVTILIHFSTCFLRICG